MLSGFGQSSFVQWVTIGSHAWQSIEQPHVLTTCPMSDESKAESNESQTDQAPKYDKGIHAIACSGSYVNQRRPCSGPLFERYQWAVCQKLGHLYPAKDLT